MSAPRMSSDWVAANQWWLVFAHHAQSHAVLGMHHAVVDDFGELVRIDEIQHGYSSQQGEPHFDHEHAAFQQRWLTPRTEPRAVEVSVETDEHAFLGRPQHNVTIGADARDALSAVYRLDVAGNYDGPLYLSHGQLAALLAAAQQLVKPVRRRAESAS